ncbi:substrate-binding domain-containing protein [Chromobacterium sp. IIBBL 290-4]|uniref:substrate-binding domain-containing protein n=1 Tax=Chromobacterium sp. IIBBL 290-4 TaxID=2953890 RepID=UPI0020B8F5F0|nr:substrate-binding domain-containing protein [Chromobacterium sp. IIBBL 290-4]UTH74473.1 substrate-binding domain-containing protein [Chromobacterium sp. IIBBL 290-4]
MNSVNFKAKALAIALSACMLAGAASAQTVLGGGSTLAQPLYNQLFGITSGYPSLVLGNWNYAGVGSGAGKAAFLTNNAALFNSTGNVSFAGSDSVLTAADLTSYSQASNNAWGPVIQIPAVLTSVTLPYKRSGVTQLNLTSDQVCQVFSNKAQTWGKLLGTNDATPINVVYRSDASGTTELLSNFLSTACKGYGFVKSNVFATVVGQAVGGTIPSNWVPANGSGGIKTALASDGTFTYLSPDYSISPSDPTVVASINGQLPSNISIPSFVIPPSTPANLANPLKWVPTYVPPLGGSSYPIYGTTNLLVNQCYADGIGAGSVGGAVKDFLTKLNNGAFDSQISSNYFVKLPATWLNQINATFLAGDGNGLDIGNASVCNGIGRPVNQASMMLRKAKRH